MTRHQRRRLARKRKEAKAEVMLRRALHVLATERTRANLSQPYRGKRTPRGMVSSLYGGAANSVGFTRPLKAPTKANKGVSLGIVHQELRPAHHRADAATLEHIIRQAERLVKPPKKR